MTNFFDVAHAHSKATNKNSAMAVSGGLSYSPSHAGHEDFDIPPPYFLLRDLRSRVGSNKAAAEKVSELYGFKSFRLTVLGLANEPARKCGNARYICKCSCGMYCYRTSKQLRKAYQCCGICRMNYDRINKHVYQATGKNPDPALIWQRMGGA